MLMKCIAALLSSLPMLCGADYRGQVKLGELAIPGAVVTATQGSATLSALTNAEGEFAFLNAAAGTWQVEISMSGFAPIRRGMTDEGTAQVFALQILPYAEMQAQIQAQVQVPPPPAPAAVPVEETAAKTVAAKKPNSASGAFAGLEPSELAQRAADGMLINGSAINGAASPFGQGAAFGNNRRGGKSLYSGSLGIIFDQSSWDARPYSLTGQSTPRPDFSRLQGLASFGGPIRIPKLIRNGPNVVLTYQWTRNGDVTTQSSLVPTLAQRSGDLSQLPGIVDPATGAPFSGGVIPASRISPQAKALLQLYPLPNFVSSRYNFQTALQGATHDDALQSRVQQRISRKDQLSGNFAYQNTRTDTTNLFGFRDGTRTTGINTGLNWIHTVNNRLYAVLGFQFSRLSTNVDPYFSSRRNISGEAGIGGNLQDAVNWGPPTLTFASGIASLQDAQFSRNHNQTSGTSLEVGWNKNKHYAKFGGDYRRQQWNALYQENPRGSFAFTGQATGDDFTGFLLGVPDTSALAFGNADKYFRAPSYDTFVADDWRVKPNLTLTYGLRWEYSAPIHELYGRLVNLNVTPNFSAATPVIGFSSGADPSSLIHPDRNNFAPRFGFALRPFGASSMVVRGGYGIYYDTSVYQWIATQMAQQSPLSTSLRVQNSADNPLTLADGFRTSAGTTRNTFAVDPRFRLGYAQNFQFSVQRDLPKGLVMLVSYLGIKGTRAQQQFLPNTFPAGAANVCVACPTGFAYLTSNGDSTRHAGDVEVRRRIRNGLGITVHYTFSKSLDNAALGGKNQGGPLIAQDWLDLNAERARSYFDQRHLLTVTTQYTSGMGVGGGTLLGGWRGTLLKEWTVTNKLSAGSGFPLTPVYFAAVSGTGVTGSIRPDYTGAALYNAPPGLYLNPAAYTAPAPGHWGNAGRNSITGPAQVTMNASLARTFRRGDRWSLDVRVDATNALNHPVFPGWNTIVTSSQFGLPFAANPMRSLQTTIRARF